MKTCKMSVKGSALVVCAVLFFLFIGTGFGSEKTISADLDVLRNRIPKSDKALAPDFMEKLFGPTDINGAVGNGRLAAGISATGTVSVLKWPRPSFHDQLRYLTLSRSLDRMGARENDGIFLGLLFPELNRTLWLRDADSISQQYLDIYSNILVTTYTFIDPALHVELFDLVPQNPDALVRHVRIQALDPGATLPGGLVAFSNLALCRFKLPAAPVADWLFDSLGKDKIRYMESADLLMQEQMVTDANPSIHAVMGFAEPTASYHCGKDGSFSQGGLEAFQDASDGLLSMSKEATGQVDGAIAIDLNFDRDGRTEGTFFIAFAHDTDSAIDSAKTIRDHNPDRILSETHESHLQWIEKACLPETSDERLSAVSRRALLLTRIVRDEQSGALGCSVATQPPYSLDWIRDGAFVNLMLDIAGYNQIVTEHNLFYSSIQRKPLGSWDMCVYGDGTIGGPLFLELDTLAFGAWTLWDHYRFLKGVEAEEYLFETFPAIENAADFFLYWRDPETKLPLPAWESDFPTITSTLLSAEMAWLSLRCAINAGETIGHTQEKLEQWKIRQGELTEAIFTYYFDSEQELFLGDPYTLAYLIYPVGFLPPDYPRVQRVADELYTWLESIINGHTAGGSYLGLISIALAKAWELYPDKLERLNGILEFLSYQLPTSGTLHYGECFVTLPDRFECRTGVPHPMTAALTYITAAYTFGTGCPEDSDDDDDLNPDHTPDEQDEADGLEESYDACGC